MKRVLVTAAFALGLFSGPCGAAERQPFETVKGWEVERTVGDTGANPCLMTHAYEDKEDNNAANAVVFALDGDKALLVLVYQGWDWDKEETVKVPFVLDKKLIKGKSVWIGDGKALRTTFPNEIVPNLLAAKTVILRFEDSDADFDIRDFAAGYEALKRCDAAANRPVATVAAPAPVPAKERIAAYAIGVAVEQVIRTCEVGTTGRQRAAFEAKMAALKPEMAALDSEIRTQMGKRGEPCPSAADEPKFQTTLRDFIDKSPEDFAATLEKRGAEAAQESPGKDGETPKP